MALPRSAPAACLGLLALAWTAAVRSGGSGPSPGREVYLAHCAVCHGAEGDGQGEAASRFRTPPRDFGKGVYKFRSTHSGQVPTDEDLARSVVRGIPGTAMVPQDHLGGEAVRAVVDHIKAFSERFDGAVPREVKTPARLPRSPELLERGRKAYEKGRCAQCHGAEGRGDGPSAGALSVAPTDFTRRPLKSGPEPRDLVRSILTGLDGTPMPSYDLFFTRQELWGLAHYLDRLGGPPRMTEDERLGWEVEGREPPEGRYESGKGSERERGRAGG